MYFVLSFFSLALEKGLPKCPSTVSKCLLAALVELERCLSYTGSLISQISEKQQGPIPKCLSYRGEHLEKVDYACILLHLKTNKMNLTRVTIINHM